MQLNPEKEEPLVSVIIRTIGRVTLKQALDSVCAQSFANVEIVLVDADGAGNLEQWREQCERPLKVVCRDHPLKRAAAANAGLAAASGDFLMFLDDDDWLLPDHVQVLTSALRCNERSRVVYSGVKCCEEVPQAAGDVC